MQGWPATATTGVGPREAPVLRAAGAALGVGTWPFGALSLTRWPQIRLCNPSRNSVNYLLFYKIIFSLLQFYLFLFFAVDSILCAWGLWGEALSLVHISENVICNRRVWLQYVERSWVKAGESELTGLPGPFQALSPAPAPNCPLYALTAFHFHLSLLEVTFCHLQLEGCWADTDGSKLILGIRILSSLT